MSVVVDASALVHATTLTSISAVRTRRQLAEEVCHAPHLIDAEYGNVLRRLVARHELAAEHGSRLLGLAPALIDHRHAHRGALARAAWSLRANLSFYDATYVALAAALDLPLLTIDRRLAAAPGLPCGIDLIGD